VNYPACAGMGAPASSLAVVEEYEFVVEQLCCCYPQMILG